jgi:hypothetical protein
MMSINLTEQNVRERDKIELIIPTDKFERQRVKNKRNYRYSKQFAGSSGAHGD